MNATTHVPLQGQAAAQAAADVLLDRIDRAIAALQDARGQLVASTCGPIVWQDSGWSWSCRGCPGPGHRTASEHLDDVAAFRRGHLRAVHGVETVR